MTSPGARPPGFRQPDAANEATGALSSFEAFEKFELADRVAFKAMARFHMEALKMALTAPVHQRDERLIRRLKEPRRMLPWPEYAGSLFELDSTVEERRRLKDLWNAAAASQAAADKHLGQADLVQKSITFYPEDHAFTPTGITLRRSPPPPRPLAYKKLHSGDANNDKGQETIPPVRPVRPLLDSELQATCEVGFTDLLRAIQVRSGLNPAQIAARTGLPRSQAYSLINRNKLPTKPDQVRAFITICGLPDPQVQRVMALWAELRERRDRVDPLLSAVDDFRLWAPLAPFSKKEFPIGDFPAGEFEVCPDTVLAIKTLAGVFTSISALRKEKRAGLRMINTDPDAETEGQQTA